MRAAAQTVHALPLSSKFLPRQFGAAAKRRQFRICDVPLHRDHAAIRAGDDFFLGHVAHRVCDDSCDFLRRLGYGGFKVISIDYRMPPDHPYPAAMDDAMAVWREAVKLADPRNIAIFGTSTGGGMTLAMILRAKQEGLPLPAAIAPGTPWSDLTETGDTYKTNEWLDYVLVSYNGYLRHAAELYAHGHDLKDPQLSPIYGDFSGFPPAILTSGTRDLFLSLTVLTHRKLRRAGVEAELQVFEGMSHAEYNFNPFAPETKEAFTEIAHFFDKHLGK